MIKKTITFNDYNGVERKEDFYFNLSKFEVMKMEMGKKGGLAEYIQSIVAAQDAPSIIAIFEDLVLKAYGVKSADGREFIKNDQVRDSFKQTEAYSIICMELATDADAAAKFINGIVPADLSAEMKKAEAAKTHPALKE